MRRCGNTSVNGERQREWAWGLSGGSVPAQVTHGRAPPKQDRHPRAEILHWGLTSPIGVTERIQGHAHLGGNYNFSLTNLLGNQTDYQWNHRKIHIPWPLLEISQILLRLRTTLEWWWLQNLPLGLVIWYSALKVHILLHHQLVSYFYNMSGFFWNNRLQHNLFLLKSCTFYFMHGEILFCEDSYWLHQRSMGNPSINQ